MVYEKFIQLLKEGHRKALEQARAVFREVLREEFALGAKPETDYNSTTTADDAFINIIPPNGQYVYLMCITANVGTDGDVVELQVLCTDDKWRIVDRLKMLANTSMIKGYPNMKLDKIKVAGTEYTVKEGDGTTAIVRLVSRGTGGWEASIQYFCGE